MMENAVFDISWTVLVLTNVRDSPPTPLTVSGFIVMWLSVPISGLESNSLRS